MHVQHLLNVIYKEALRRGVIEDSLEVLGLPLKPTNAGNVKATGRGNPKNASSQAVHAGDRVAQSELASKQSDAFEQAMTKASSEGYQETYDTRPAILDKSVGTHARFL